jgi:hypothetical protein
MKIKIIDTFRKRECWRVAWGRTGQSNDSIQQLQQVAEFLRSAKSCSKLTIFQDQGYFYCNDTALAYTLSKFTGVTHLGKIKEILVNRPRDTIQLTESDHSHRTYFREQKISGEKKLRILEFLKLQPGIAMSPALKQWFRNSVGWWSFRIQRHHFIDHNNCGSMLMLQIISPRLIRKTVGITVVNNRETNNGKDKRRSASD